MKNLVLITNSFPEKGKETFLVDELPFLSNNFDKIYIFTLKKINNQVNLPKNVHVSTIFVDIVTKKDKLTYLLGYMRSFIRILKTEKRPNAISLLLKYGVQSDRLKSFLEANKINANNTLFYTYWLDEGAAILALLKERLTSLNVISRAHGYDLYEEDYPNGLPYFYNYSLSRINTIYFISENGKEYFVNKHKVDIALEISKLGTKDYGLGPLSGDQLVVATCSSIISLKRLELLANALIKLNGKNIIWHHHGDGPLKKEILALVSNCTHLTTYFHGQVGNEKLMEFYKYNYVSLFVNVSSTEGLPVSLVEAASFGIPLLATNVRGTKEICTSETGVLVDAGITAAELALKIENTLNIDWNRMKIREYWKSNFLGANNFNEFAKKIAVL